MENEIKVNEYVRTKRGIIDKAVKILDNYIFLESKFFITEYGESFTFIKKTDVVKHSSNLIDLIENKDILKVRIDKTIMFFGIDESTSDTKYKEIIKSIENGECELLEILTHQQFEANYYKVGGLNNE